MVVNHLLIWLVSWKLPFVMLHVCGISPPAKLQSVLTL